VSRDLRPPTPRRAALAAAASAIVKTVPAIDELVAQLDFTGQKRFAAAIREALRLLRQREAAFGRYVAATYADQFDSYSGERLQVTGKKPFAANIVVETRVVKSDGKPVEIDYLMYRDGGFWQIADVYLDGTISQLAVRRSEFYSILKQQGVDGLIAALNRKVDLLTNIAKAR
jgi:ABC-type transporter MlaC component